MRKIALTTAAAAMLVASFGAAAAQTPPTPAPGSVPKTESTEHQAPGALTGALKGDINGPGAAKAAQPPAKNSKADDDMGQHQQKQ